MISSIIGYFSSVKLEFSKIVWVSKKELSHLTVVVLMITVFTACSFLIIDSLVSSLVMKIVSI